MLGVLVAWLGAVLSARSLLCGMAVGAALLTAYRILAYTVLRFVAVGGPIACGRASRALVLVRLPSSRSATRPLSRLMRRPETVRTCDRVTGAIFVAFGVGLALSARRP